MAPPGTPERPDDDSLVVIGVVEVAVKFVEIEPSGSRDRAELVRRADTRQQREQVERSSQLVFKQLPLTAVLQPPSVLLVDLGSRRKGERNVAAGQRALSSRRTSSASTTRPAATSDSDRLNA